MRVLCSPDAFKGSMTAATAARQMALGVRDAGPGSLVDCCPVSDGGEGFRATLAGVLDGGTTRHRVSGPLGDEVEAGVTFLAATDDAPLTAVLEMAEAAGLELAHANRRNPELTTTRGVGELVRIALDAGARRILLGLGGSATVDGGLGMARALGYRFFDRDGRALAGPLGGGDLPRVARIDPEEAHSRLRECDVRAACDVNGPLLGPDGAAVVFGPQKGATPEQVDRLEAGLRHLADVLRDDLGVEVATTPGAGAAGGLGAGAIAFLGARLEPGIEIVLEAVRFEERLCGVDLCLTGEGRIDAQTMAGKAVLGVARAARAQGVPTIALVGRIGRGADSLPTAELAKIHAFGENLPIEDAMARGPELIRLAARDAVKGSRENR